MTPKSRLQKILPIVAFVILITSTLRSGLSAPILQASTHHNDETVRALIKKVHDVALNVRVDGKGDDWADVPSFPGTATPCPYPNRKITRFAIAPLKSGLLVMIRTKVQPTTDSRTFWLDINYMGSKENNIRIGLDPSDNDRLWIYEPGKPAVGKDFSGLHMAVGDVVEALIPYRVLTPLLPGAMDITMRFPDHPWIRVTPSAYDPYSKRVDVGPAVASYWLIPDATALDPPPPAPSLIASTLSVPFVGKWYVSQGALTQGSHKGVWAYDLAMVDETGSFSSVADANQNEYQYCWNQPILSPVDGVVTSVTSDVPDHVANTKLVASSTVPSNVVSVARPDGIVVSMIHCRMNTARVLVGDQVSVGQELARVGNSGNSEGPHLHLQCSSEGGTVPFVFRNVTVSINQLKDDPWRRDLPIWQPAEGYFLESTGNAATN